MSEIFEIIMVLCFGASWPFNIVRSWRSGTAKGKSFVFLVLIIIGYIAGIICKLTNEVYLAEFASKWYVLVFYVINLTMVSVDLGIYFRNKKLDARVAV